MTEILTPTDMFRALYGDEKLPGSLVISYSKPGRDEFRCTWTSNVDSAASMAALKDTVDACNVYFGVCLQEGSKPKHRNSRGFACTAIAMPGMYFEVDAAKPGKNGKIYFPTLEAASHFLCNHMPFQPTLIVGSGGGLHPYWLFKELLVFGTAEERQRAGAISRGWLRVASQKAKSQGFDIDATADLARVLRPVGTLNRNYEPARAVQLLEYWPDRRYTLDDFEQFEAEYQVISAEPISEFTIPTGPIDPANLGTAFQACWHNDDRGTFRQAWEKTRKIGKDGSASGYAWMIARRLHHAGATPQEIVNAVTTWRYRHGELDDKHRQMNWWTQELNRVRQKLDEDGAPQGDTPKPGKPDPTSPAIIKLTDEFALLPVKERITKACKVVVQLKLIKGAEAVQLVDVTSTVSNQKAVAQQLASIASPTGDVDIGGILNKLICDAHERLTLPAGVGDQDGETIREIVFRQVPRMWELKYRTGDGKAWSEMHGRPVGRQEFCCCLPESLLISCAAAVDADADEVTGIVDEIKLIRSIEQYLKVLWSTLFETLPHRASDSDLDSDTGDALKFRNTIIDMWHTLAMNESILVQTGHAPMPSFRKASLASRVRTEFIRWKDGEYGSARRKWFEIQNGYAAWWRPVHLQGGGGAPTVLLAMNFELFKQLRTEPPGAADRESLKPIGVRYGVFSDTPPVTEGGVTVTDRRSKGPRLCILAPELTEEILAQPAEIDERPEIGSASDSSDAGEGVTGEEFHENAA